MKYSSGHPRLQDAKYQARTSGKLLLSGGLPLTDEQKAEYKYIDENGNAIILTDIADKTIDEITIKYMGNEYNTT